MAANDKGSTAAPGPVVEPGAGTGIRKNTTRKSIAPICNMPTDIAIDLSFQATSFDTSIYITDGQSVYFEADMMVNEATRVSVPTFQLPRGNYYLIIADEDECYYKEFTMP